jgi:hypothetical protein
LDKDLIFLDPHSFDKKEDYSAHVKEIHLKLAECGNKYQKKDGKLIKMVLMNFIIPFDMFMSTLHTNWKEHKDYAFEF